MLCVCTLSLSEENSFWHTGPTSISANWFVVEQNKKIPQYTSLGDPPGTGLALEKEFLTFTDIVRSLD